MVGNGNGQVEKESRAGDRAKEKQNVGQGRAGQRVELELVEDRVGSIKDTGYKKKRSHATVLLHTRQISGLLVKELDR